MELTWFLTLTWFYLTPSLDISLQLSTDKKQLWLWNVFIEIYDKIISLLTWLNFLRNISWKFLYPCQYLPAEPFSWREGLRELD